VRARREPKNKAKKGIPKKPKHVFFSRVRPDYPRCCSATWICMCGHTHDLIIYSKFHRNPFRGFGAPGGQNLSFPITLAIRFYNSLYYRTCRDSPKVLRHGSHSLTCKLQHACLIFQMAPKNLKLDNACVSYSKKCRDLFLSDTVYVQTKH